MGNEQGPGNIELRLLQEEKQWRRELFTPRHF
jgi:hypothetical protein